ncbi:MAG: hypothetical protein IPK46_12040 [Saprospiraceae bacterium]|nr:hypothetical protein [Saprospiraceae bacterium]
MNKILLPIVLLLLIPNMEAQVTKITNFPEEVDLKNSSGGRVGVVGSNYFFTAATAEAGEELWLTDGTEVGTRMVKDIRPGTTSTDYGKFTAHKGKLYFFANNGANGFELWTSDGTAAGTKIVKDINPSGGIISTTISSHLFSDGQFLYFAAVSPGFGSEVWVSDGTSAGTKLLKDINTGAASSNPETFFKFNNKVYFFATSDIFDGSEMWETQGTPATTKKVKLLDDKSATIGCLVVATNAQNFYFAMRLGSGDQLWKSDGTAENTKIVATLSHSIYEMVLLENNNAIFTLNGGDNGDDIWTSNGTEAGTAVLKDLNYFLKNTPYSLIKWEDSAYVLANDKDNLLLVKTDGTQAGTSTLAEYTSTTSGGSQFLVPMNKEFLIIAYKDHETDTEILTSKGTAASTKLLANLNSIEGKSSMPADFREVRNSNIIFKAEEIEGDRQLYVYNRFVPLAGTISITNPIKCYGDSTGVLTANFNGGIGQYSYLWSTGDSTLSQNNLPKGSYSVTVTDEDGVTKSASIFLSQPDSMKITGVLTPESGGLANGKITLGVNGGTPPFKYSWSNGSIVKSPNNLAAGTYTVTVNDANNCSKEASFEILLASGTEDTQDCYPTSQQSGRELYLTTCFTDGALWLRDLNGKIILHQLFHNTNSRLDVSNLSKGIYILYFENKERNESQFLKIFIQ